MSLFDSTPNSSATGAVAGTAISDTNAGQRRTILYIEDIFDPDTMLLTELASYVVPQENEIILDVPNGIIYRAAHVDYQSTLKTTLVPWAIQNGQAATTADQDSLFGLRGGPMLGEALLSIDFSVRPNVARVDSTIMRPGAAYAKLFIGNDLSANGTIISAQYDSSVNMLNNKVPVQLAAIVDRTNLMIMTTGPFSVVGNAEGLPDGTRATLVFYDVGGEFIPPAQPVMVQHSAYMKDHQLGIKYVTAVELLSPWFTNTINPDRIIVPINVNLLSLELRALVHYSDGSSVQSAVNSGQMKLYGLREYRPKWPGQTAEATLTYQFAVNEQAYLPSPGSPNHKSVSYTLEAGAVKGAYSPKIYTYPQWDPTQGGYRLQHFLYDLDRQTFIEVTALVTYNDKSPTYKPSSYGLSQNLIFNLNLKDVASTYESVIYIQHTEIVLLKDVNGPGTRWGVNFAASKPVYNALSVSAKNNGVNTTFNLANGFTAYADWLAAMYLAVNPSYDTWNEDAAPTPTHFDLRHEDGRKWRFPVTAWHANSAINIELQLGKTWYINWVNKNSSGAELQLATTGVTVQLSS